MEKNAAEAHATPEPADELQTASDRRVFPPSAITDDARAVSPPNDTAGMRDAFRIAWPWQENTNHERLFIGRVRPTPEEIAQKLEHSYPDVSRVHAELFFDKGRLVLRDLNSLNGTYMEDRRLTPFVVEPIQSGQVVRFGSSLKVNVSRDRP